MNVTNNTNAKTKNVLDNFNYCKDFVKVETEAFIVAAFMAHFKMESYEGSINIPTSVLNGTKEDRAMWLHQHVKEIFCQGRDGERIIRCWKFLLLIFKCYNHNKYALATLQLLANINTMLTPRKAHSLIWNRTVNNKGGKGNNISLDLRMEHIVHLHKEMLANLGVNLTPECALRCSKAVKPVEDLLRTVDNELLCRRPSGKHTVTRSQSDFELIVNELHNKGKVFQCTPADNRQYGCFPKFKKTLVNDLNYNKLNNWINHTQETLVKQWKIDLWRKSSIYFTKFSNNQHKSINMF
ncbi:uncharacterized protein LOC116290877 [Actinia tenebrosa]|uniref:Uncharacterized protein LOC116290877 n=1 Tax=Actinia tenebrosa TaxID=6105 RepID=A0A6P8HMJ2_ACTTE|nr:uncharacterized protein LOC116290877 [Actinia tenebrosa]